MLHFLRFDFVQVGWLNDMLRAWPTFPDLTETAVALAWRCTASRFDLWRPKKRALFLTGPGQSRACLSPSFLLKLILRFYLRVAASSQSPLS